ncbi:MAG TPA: hypothetical protein VLE89_08335 [Chlamydiales bacterium]|nr:hypothetical protein [Chlamydiales bacterium]
MVRLLVLCAFAFLFPLQAKLLVLIICSDEPPVYRELQKIWRSYMHLDPEHVEAYFIRGKADLLDDFAIDGDVIWLKTAECFCPGILNKTILSMAAMLPRVKEFEYVLRTNLSSFYVFPRLLSVLKTFPKRQFYCGAPLLLFPGAPLLGSGSGFIVSSDLMELIVAGKHQLLNQMPADDVVLGLFLIHYGVSLTPYSFFMFDSMGAWDKGKDQIPETIFQIRVKNVDRRRLSDDIAIHSKLLEKFYRSN